MARDTAVELRRSELRWAVDIWQRSSSELQNERSLKTAAQLNISNLTKKALS